MVVAKTVGRRVLKRVLKEAIKRGAKEAIKRAARRGAKGLAGTKDPAKKLFKELATDAGEELVETGVDFLTSTDDPWEALSNFSNFAEKAFASLSRAKKNRAPRSIRTRARRRIKKTPQALAKIRRADNLFHRRAAIFRAAPPPLKTVLTKYPNYKP